MKKSGRALRTVTIVALFVAVFSLCACNKIDMSAGEELRPVAVSMTDAIMKGDIDAVYALTDPEYVQKDVITDIVPEIKEYVGQFSNFEVKELTGCTVRKTEEGTAVFATFFVDTDGKDFYIMLKGEASKPELIRGMNIALEADMNPTYTGTITTMKGADIFQWIILVIGLASMVFSLWMLIDCIKSKIEKKPVWVILVLLAYLSISFTYMPGRRANLFFTIGFIINSSTLRYLSDGSTILQIILPIGAIIYFFMRKKLKAKVLMKNRKPEEFIYTEQPTAYTAYPDADGASQVPQIPQEKQSDEQSNADADDDLFEVKGNPSDSDKEG